MKAFDFFVYLTTLVLILAACGKKVDLQQEAPRSSNRIMGFYVKVDPSVQPLSSSFESLFEKAIASAYSPQIRKLNFPGGPYPDEGENMYEIARNQIDDLLVFSVSQQNNVIKVSGNILNGSNLRTASRLNFEVSTEPSPDKREDQKTSLKDRLTKQIQTSLLAAYPNPNIWPTFRADYFANAIFAKAQSDEQALGVDVTCETAPRALPLYARAKEIFDIAQKLSLVRPYGSQSEQHLMNTRMQEADEKTKIAQLCAEDASKSFSLKWTFIGIEKGNYPAIYEAAKNSDLEEMLKKYTDKPVDLQISADASGEINLNVVMRFDEKRYSSWTKSRIPEKYRNFGILSLDPYYALMQKIVLFKYSLPESASPALKQGFNLMRMNIVLNTILGGEVIFGVGGTYNRQENKISLAYPASLLVQFPGFERKQVTTKDQELFQEKTWIALGSCKTLDGTLTEDGLVYRFFGIRCP